VSFSKHDERDNERRGCGQLDQDPANHGYSIQGGCQIREGKRSILGKTSASGELMHDIQAEKSKEGQHA